MGVCIPLWGFKFLSADSAGLSRRGRFGGPHVASFVVVFCDGSAQLVNFEIAPELHWQLGHRDDGQVTDKSSL